MGLHKSKSRLKIGLQVKSVLVLTVVVLAVTIVGGWFYYTATRDILRSADHSQANNLIDSLSVATASGLTEGNRESLQLLATGLLDRANVHHVRILNRNGDTVAVAERVSPGVGRLTLAVRPVSLSYQAPRGTDFLEIGRPVIISTGQKRAEVLVGAVRLVLDTRKTTNILADVRREMMILTVTIVLCVLPLGSLLVWRVIILPIRRLMTATRQLSEGDFSAHVETCRNDEIGELAGSFDIMVEKLNASYRRLRLANESLERKVTERTDELEQANGRLRREMAEKEDFLRAVSHDLNAPLRNIAGMATMICMKYRDELPEEVIARLQRIQSNVDAEAELIGELLELSRIRTRPERRRMVDFGRLFRSLRDSFEYELKAKGITLKIDRDMPCLYVERNRMRQVFQNLIDNAIKYMNVNGSADGMIRIGYDRVNLMHRFSVTDNGPGIAPADHERIFQVFRRADSTGVAGKGVGLAMVKSVAANYDGQVRVESEPGAGAKFYVSLSAESTTEPNADTTCTPDSGKQTRQLTREQLTITP